MAGDLKCWGEDNYGGIFRSLYSKDYVTEPKAVDPSEKYKAVASAYSSGCAITAEGLLKCWGQLNGVGSNGFPIHYFNFSESLDSANRYQLIDAKGRFDIANGVFFQNVACGITEAQELKCWGYAQGSMFGRGETNVRLYIAPTPVGGPARLWKQVSVGSSFVCGITSAGELMCWGGTLTTPTRIDAASSDTYQRVTVSGAGNACGITSDGRVKCGIVSASGAWTDWDVGTSYLRLEIGWGHRCGVTTLGETRCDGDNLMGQQGVGALLNFPGWVRSSVLGGRSTTLQNDLSPEVAEPINTSVSSATTLSKEKK
jgi:hypothetical protein